MNANPSERRSVKVILSVLGAILVGAIGSGVWQGLLGPGLRAVGIGLLSLVSLGFSSYKDSIYQGIALDNPSLGAMETFTLMNVIIMVSVGAALGKLDSWRRALARPSGQPASPTSVRNVRLALYKLFAVVGVVGVVCAINSSRINYINSALLNYHQTLRVASPYLAPQDRLAVESQFAQIRSRQDYVDILDKLGKITLGHGQKVPQFKAW